ncbi:IclR family transcriptional regulator C-terminal domain-containing protein [Streptomyces varsoviensis]|uniref:IclR family transcriptional regulator domain-containing protein n=1 Tax=Streptomyces varsoviensis TaxID=67373 RepID=UPI0033C45562
MPHPPATDSADSAEPAGSADSAEPTAPTAHDAAVVGPLERGLAVLRAMSAPGSHRLRPSDLVHATGLARSTVDRVVATLVRVGYLRAVGRDIELTPRLLELGDGYLTASGIPAALGPFAARLAEEFDESVSLAVPDGDGVRFVAQHTRRRTMSLAFRIGDLLPAERCAPGALFAADWGPEERTAWRARRRADPGDAGFPAVPPRPAVAGTTETGGGETAGETADETAREAAEKAAARVEADFERRRAEAAERGWAADDGLIEPGLIAVAVPVADAAGRVVCAVSVVSHSSRHTVHSLAAAVLPRLREDLPAMAEALAAPPARPSPAPPPPPRPVQNEHGASEYEPGAAEYEPEAAKAELGSGYLQSLARGLAVLRALGVRPGGPSLARVAEATGLARATTRRALLSLEQLGYAASHGRLFHPLPRVLELGYAHLSGLGFPDIVQPHLEALAARVRESASMAVLDGDEIRYIARVPTYRIMSVNIGIGTRFPAYATSMGRVLLAGLPAEERAARLVRAEPRPLTPRTVTDPRALARILDAAADGGHALVDEELEEGLRSIAVPVRDVSGRVVAALNVSTHAGRGTAEETRAALLPALRHAQAQVEADLRAWRGELPS